MTIMMIKTDGFRSWRDRRDLGRFATLPETVGCSLAAQKANGAYLIEYKNIQHACGARFYSQYGHSVGDRLARNL